MKMRSIKQQARIILNSDDAIKTTNANNTIPVRDPPIAFDAASGTIVNTTTYEINYYDHRLTTGEALTYTSTGTVMTGLTANQVVYAIVVSPSKFKVALNAGNAALGTAIAITGVGTNIHTFSRTIAFDGSVDTVVSVGLDIITLAAHGLNTGDYVQYTTTGTAIGGLTANLYYYVIAVGPNTIRLANTFQEATADVPTFINITALGVGTGHNLIKRVSFNTAATPVIDLVREIINIPAHGLNTGDRILYQIEAGNTAVPPLIDNTEYWVISVDANSIQLAGSLNDATVLPLNPINLTATGVGNNHTLTRIVDVPVPVCTNYNFKLPSFPFSINDKSRLAVQTFDFAKNYNTFNCKSVGGVYLKSLQPSNNTYTTQGYNKGTLLLPANFQNSITYQNSDIEYNSIPLPSNFGSVLQNGLDIFIDSKKRNYLNADIQGCINEDRFNLSLIVYEIEDFDYLYQDLSEKQKNYMSIALQ